MTEFTEMMTNTVLLYPGYELTQETIALYWEYLKDLPMKSIKIAMARAPSTSVDKFPSEITIRCLAFPISMEIKKGTHNPEQSGFWWEDEE